MSWLSVNYSRIRTAPRHTSSCPGPPDTTTRQLGKRRPSVQQSINARLSGRPSKPFRSYIHEPEISSELPSKPFISYIHEPEISSELPRRNATAQVRQCSSPQSDEHEGGPKSVICLCIRKSLQTQHNNMPKTQASKQMHARERRRQQ